MQKNRQKWCLCKDEMQFRGFRDHNEQAEVRWRTEAGRGSVGRCGNCAGVTA
jgi:hypothetical protein